MIKIGITGQNGFLGWHLYNTLGLYPERYERIEFKREFFDSDDLLDRFVSSCDVIIHLAAMNRHHNQHVIYETNVALVEKLIASLLRTQNQGHVLFSSSLQEETNNPYGRSKLDGRKLLEEWAVKSGGTFTGMIIPNVFGPFGLPNYNSFVATFSYRLTHNQQPEVNIDGDVRLIYVSELVNEFIKKINFNRPEPFYRVPHTMEIKVSEVLLKLEAYKSEYLEKGEVPLLNNTFDLNLFNTFRSYIDYERHFPIKLKQNIDSRGTFIELIRLGMGGQVSFSTTLPGVTRGNHYHTRKIERFCIVKGRALIQMRKIGTEKILSFEIDSNEPAYVDIPIWYTHNIKNIGEEIVYTNFWINEAYDPTDADTYFEDV